MKLFIKDNFLPDAEETRKKVLASASFAGEDYEGHFYPGVDTGNPLEALELIEEVVDNDIDPKLAFWRLSAPGEGTPAPIHADGICAKWAGILYLSEAPENPLDGTAFWTHKETGDSHVPRAMQRGSKARTKDYFEMLKKDSGDEAKWDMTFMIKSKFNRFSVYPTNYFHSRYPFFSENYGTSKEEARLIWVVFFNSPMSWQ